jgi:hypothetical protein
MKIRDRPSGVLPFESEREKTKGRTHGRCLYLLIPLEETVCVGLNVESNRRLFHEESFIGFQAVDTNVRLDR